MPAKFQAARFNANKRLLGCHSQFGRWPARLSKDCRFFSRPRVPTYDGKQAAGLEHVMDNMRKASLVGNAVKGICEKNVIGRVFHNLPDVISVSFNKYAVGCAAVRTLQPQVACNRCLWL